MSLIILFCLLSLSAVFSGSETGVYSLSRVRLEAEANAGARAARGLRRLVRSDSALLVTLLVGNNMMLEAATHLMQSRLEELPNLPAGARELVLTLCLTPIVFLFGELLPKDLFRRRPHQFLTALLPILWLTRILLLPLVWPLVQLSRLLEHLFGLKARDLGRALRREEVLNLVAGTSSRGILHPAAAKLARNVMVLRETPVKSVMLPWRDVRTVNLTGEAPEVYGSVQGSAFTRLPAVGLDSAGKRSILGYLHQLDVLSAEMGDGLEDLLGGQLEGQIRDLLTLPPDLPLDQVLKRMRTSGQRIALVGTPEEPLGFVSLMDLLATITEASAS